MSLEAPNRGELGVAAPALYGTARARLCAAIGEWKRALQVPETHRVLAAEHEANLPAGICGDGAIGVFHNREQRLAELTHLLNEIQVQPLALTYREKGRRKVRAAPLLCTGLCQVNCGSKPKPALLCTTRVVPKAR